MPVWLIVIIVLVVLLILYIAGTYNKLVNARNKAEGEWAQIDVQLKRRIDLIPNLVETVKGYAAHEKDTLEAVINARNSAVGAKTPEEEMKAAGEVTQALSRLFALSEAYPDLKANTNFVDLQNSLKETEDKIAYARQFYNDAAKSYKNVIQMFPSNIVANMFGFKALPYFEIEAKDKEVPQVKF